MSTISTIILTFNESLHIKRCIENLKQISDTIYVVDSYSTDDTVEIAKSLGAEVFQNKWPGNQAAQFNWALENLPLNTEWILRIDADEYFLPELVQEVKSELSSIPQSITGIVFKRRHFFLGKWMKKGIYPVKLLRMFRRGKAKCEQRWMDEHIELLEGSSMEFKHDFVDHNLQSLGWFIDKHNNYAIREAVELLDLKYQLIGNQHENSNLGAQATAKRNKKLKYAKQPLFWRSFAYFIYRYFFKLGFTEGKEGFLWHFLQGWWYRTLVDAKIFEIEKACGQDTEAMKKFITEKYGIELNS